MQSRRNDLFISVLYILQICIDVFLLVQHYADVATLSTLTHSTGGSLYHYLPFNPLMDQDQLLNDLKWNVSRAQVTPGAFATCSSCPKPSICLKFVVALQGQTVSHLAVAACTTRTA